LIYITAIQMSGGNQHTHIANVMWLDGANGKADISSTEQMIEFIDKPNTVQIGGRQGPVIVAVIRTPGQKPFLRTHADKQWSDNLLALPRF